MLVHWLCSSFDESHFLHAALPLSDLRLVVIQVCTHLLAAGVIRRLEDISDDSTAYIFKVRNGLILYIFL